MIFDISVTRQETHLLIDKPGVYVLFSSTGLVMYIGKSMSIYSRVNGHFCGNGHLGQFVHNFNKASVIYSNGDIDELETKLINSLNPLLNLKKTYTYKREADLSKYRIGRDKFNVQRKIVSSLYNKGRLSIARKNKPITYQMNCLLLKSEVSPRKKQYFIINNTTLKQLLSEKTDLRLDDVEANISWRFRNHYVIVDDAATEIELHRYYNEIA